MEQISQELNRFAFTDGANELTLEITDEGIIMDAFVVEADGVHDQNVGTRAMTFDEWFDFIIDLDPLGQKHYRINT